MQNVHIYIYQFSVPVGGSVRVGVVIVVMLVVLMVVVVVPNMVMLDLCVGDGYDILTSASVQIEGVVPDGDLLTRTSVWVGLRRCACRDRYLIVKC